jgi:hypothetical protein
MNHMKLRAIVALVPLVVVLVSAATATAELGFLPHLKSGFTFSGGEVMLATSTGALFSCKGSNGKGKLVTDKEVSIELDLKECALGFLGSLNSLGDASGTILVNRTAVVCLLNEASLTFALKIPMGEAGLHIEWPAGGSLLLVKGALFGQISPTTKAKAFSLNIAGKDGKQEITRCAGGKEEPLVVEQNSDKEPIGLSESFGGAKLTFEEEVELMDK